MQKSMDSRLLLKGLTLQKQQHKNFSSSMYSTVQKDKKLSLLLYLTLSSQWVAEESKCDHSKANISMWSGKKMSFFMDYKLVIVKNY